MQRPILIEQSILTRVALASMAKALAKLGIQAKNTWGAEVESEVRELVDLVEDNKLDPSDILIMLTQRATTTDHYAPNKFAAIKKLTQEVTLEADKIVYDTKDAPVTLKCTGGVIDWSGDVRSGITVNLSRALLAKEIACDAQVVKGKPMVVPRQETGTFKLEYNQVQPLRAVEVTKKAEFNKMQDLKGYVLADRMYENLKTYDSDDVKWAADRLHSADPNAIRTGKDADGNPTTKYDETSYNIQNQAGDIVKKKGVYRSVSGCVRNAKMKLEGAQMFHLIEHFDKHIGGKKFGAGKMINDFFFGVPIDSIYMKGLKILTIVKNLRDKMSPIAIHAGDKLLAAFIATNTGRSVGYCGEMIDNAVDLKKKQDNKELWQYDINTTPQNCIIIYPKPITFFTGTDYSKTYAGSKTILETLLDGRPARSIVMAHVYAVSDWLGTDDKGVVKIGNNEVSMMLNYSLATKHVIVGKGSNMFNETWTGGEANIMIKNFFANYPSYRYHRIPFARITKALTLPPLDTTKLKNGEAPPDRRLGRFPFVKLSFEFVNEKDIIGDDMETIDPTYLSGELLMKWQGEWTDLVKGLENDKEAEKAKSESEGVSVAGAKDPDAPQDGTKSDQQAGERARLGKVWQQKQTAAKAKVDDTDKADAVSLN